MRRFRELEQIVQRAEQYETEAARKRRVRAEARVHGAAENGQTIADGGVIVADSASPAREREEQTYTQHVEPPEQGGKQYIRCTHCTRELLVELGGHDKLPHATGCPERESQ